MNEPIKVLIIDDERYARQELAFLLEAYEFIDVIGEASNGEDAVVKALQLQPDVVFLDMEMPKIPGLEVAKSLQDMKKVPLIVFATAYPQFAAKAFRLPAVDYLLKPYDESELAETVTRIQNRLQPETAESSRSNSLKKLAIEVDGEIIYMPIDEIYYIFRDEKTTKMIAKTGELDLRVPLKDLEEKLKNYAFFRIHKSYLVNLDYVHKLSPWFNGAYQLEMENRKEKLPVSRNYVKALKNRLAL
ncbi:LytTR family DNA-binding domain-containing protein [Lentibacillus sp. L22]|uniref:LytR/AlgR family response regulator transcription factor n=1 Tax=Lentibacillus TaxID=175304 RepID=UPI0022B0C734|nr:LytTR family DNA-binding domain-containing protein [Lentibacillus daqui]